jgi:tryptophan 7-halogenase
MHDQLGKRIDESLSSFFNSRVFTHRIFNKSQRTPNRDLKMDTRIQSIVILGGGTAGWMAAAAIANRFANNPIQITLIESADIGTIGVGEATVPFIKEFLKSLNIDEIDFIQATKATYKLGISFDGWKHQGHSFLHPFAGYGARIDNIPFHHFWIKMMQLNKAQELDTYCLSSQIARAHKFALPKPNQDVELSSFNYAFHFDATLFAKYLSNYAKKLGVKRIEATVQNVMQNETSGFIKSLGLSNDQTIEGELFIDCSGFKGLLIEETLKTGYESWNQWLPCDRAVAMPCESDGEPAPYTRSLACEAGWQWRIQLQKRTGNGYVYSSNHISDEQAIEQLRRNLEGKPLAPPTLMRFVTGMRAKSWNKNVYAIGLSSGFLEPLESTSIYMIQESINLLIDNFPNNNWHSQLMDETNKVLRIRQEKLRDFIILHYYLNERQGENFWDACRNMSIPATLVEQIELFKHTAQISITPWDFFRTNSWLAMFAGFNRIPDYYHPFVDNFDETLLEKELDAISTGITNAITGLPTHQQFIQKNCR